ncbi:aspartate kinase [Ligilactobacillus salitolerans]|uniref:Aspartokinase n=1 Tax=Ligilactobacillus salitolerans TaxID=1808352 RepID=A0A401IS57_9LACO|nr:aspartate kinase [Ligilactobacillus salitolerans]GBG94373.1 aspartate kinase [Ligilactobacillus salitolerans]
MKVVKFGGSSLADGTQLAKVLNIIKADPERKIIVVSAPGKRFDKDKKITDLLIKLAKQVANKVDYQQTLNAVKERYQLIIDQLSLGQAATDLIETNFSALLSQKYASFPEQLDAFKASGEDNNAQLIALYFTQSGLPAKYVSPQAAGLYVSDEPGHAQVLPEAYQNLKKLELGAQRIVFPGFFGVSKSGKKVTFARGGSDITGAVLANGVHADLYENFTDVDAIYAANPNIISQPEQVHHLTYREMRELSYAGFSVFHHEAVRPAIMANIPIEVKNTNNPTAPGTLITKNKPIGDHDVTGMASSHGFESIYVAKYLMNDEVGIGYKALGVMADHGISVEHIPTGIDEMSLVVKENQIPAQQEEELLHELQEKLEADDVHRQTNLTLIMLVGEKMATTIGTAAKAMTALAEAGIGIRLFNQSSSGISIMFALKEEDEETAIKALYQAFF